MKFEGVWDDLEARNCFHRQSFKKAFVKNSRVYVN